MGLFGEKFQGIYVGAGSFVEDVEVGMVAAVAAAARTALHITGVAQVAFRADLIAYIELGPQANAVDAVQYSHLVVFIFDDQRGIADGVKVVLGDNAVDRRLYGLPFPGSDVNGHVTIGETVYTLGDDVFVIGGDNRRRVSNGKRWGQRLRFGVVLGWNGHGRQGYYGI